MRIAVFTTDDFLPPAGGAEVALGEIIKRLPEIEFDIHCAKLFTGRPRTQQVGNALIHRYGFAWGIVDKFLLVLQSPFIVARAHRRKKFDIAWSMMASWGGLAAAKTKRLCGLPYLLTLQEGDAFEDIDRRTRWIRPWFHQIFQNAVAVQAISIFLERWGGRMGFGGSVSRVIPNGVDIENFSKTISSDRLAEVRQSFGFAPDAFILMTASRLVKKNGVQDVIEALPLLPEHVCFVICGFGHLEQILRDRVHVLGLDHRVKFLGLVTHDRLPEVLRASDVFIRAALTEGLGNSFLEAMGVGVPVIGTMVGGIPDFLTDGQTGFVCEPLNPKSVASTVERVMNSSTESRTEICERAAKMVKERFSWDVVARQVRELFEEITKH
ncbi:glycosyltransferase family 4 protein [Patescibacteria group bacterium]|nr:glycosyltransferase family 4 protein [Patescibacteria group bacterium]